MWIRALLVCVSALLAILVFAPMSWTWLALVAWVPLMVALRGVSPRAGAWLGFSHGLLFYGCTMSWIADVFGSWSMLPPLVVVMALFSLVFGGGFAFGFQRYGASWRFASFTGLWWIAGEFVRSEIYFLKFPWMTPGVGLGPSLLSPVVGVYAMSLLIVMAAVLLVNGGRQRVIGGLLLLVAAFSAVDSTVAELGARPVKVMALQVEIAQISDFLKRVDDASEKVDVVVLPEYTISYDVRRSPQSWSKLLKFAEDRGLVMVLGTQTETEESYYNTALTFDASGTLGEHYKNHTVHFFNDGERGADC